MHYSMVVCVHRYILFTYVHCIGLPADLVQLLQARRMDAVRRQSLSRRGVCVCVCVFVCASVCIFSVCHTHVCEKDAVPPGWKVSKDQNGNLSYYNKELKVTQWSRPGQFTLQHSLKPPVTVYT